MIRKILRNIPPILFAIVSVGFPTVFGQEAKDVASPTKLNKISVEELVARHIVSIGSREDLGAIKSRVMMGEGKLVSKLGSTFLLTGPAQFASEGNRVLFAMVFESGVYPYEKIAYDGKDQSFGLPSGKTTFLAAFLKSQDSVLKDGLFGGTLSSAWILLNLKGISKPKLDYAGVSTIDGRPCYKINYSSGRTGDLKVTLYFDGETYRHVRTEYKYTIQGRIGTSSTDVRSSSNIERYSLVENFGDFKTAGKLTLPFSYSIDITNTQQIESRTGTVSREWSLKIVDVYYDQPLGPDAFKVS